MTRIHRRTVHQTSRDCNILPALSPFNNNSATITSVRPTTDMPPAPTWCYNARLRIITHEPRTCDTCTSWALHYMEHILTDEISLCDAERERDVAIIGNLREERDSLLLDNAALHDQLSNLNAMIEECTSQKDQAQRALQEKQTQFTEISEQLSNLQENRPRKLPRRETTPQTSTQTHTDISMDEDYNTSRPYSAPPRLLSRIQPPDPTNTLSNAEQALEPYRPHAPQCDFPALIPIIHYGADFSLQTFDIEVPLTEEGTIDFRAHPRYVLATTHISPDGTHNYQTTLVKRERFLTPEAIAARKLTAKLPLVGLVLGGRNGALISPEKDPRTQAEVDALFNAPEKIGHARAYVERIRFTPPELRGDLHSRALDLWAVLQLKTKPTSRPEPLPATHTSIWKRWLRQMRTAEVHFRYMGIPLVGNGYQNAHIEGNRALLTFLPLNIKGTAIRNGPLRSNFLSAAAALLGVPQRYEQLLNQKQSPIHHIRRSEPYSEAQFGSAFKLGIEQVARFLAWNGVPPDEAEQWRPWATAYIEMELIEHPGSARAPSLRQARDLARKRIAYDPTLALTSVHVDAPGNYNPALEQSRETRNTQITPLLQETYVAALDSQQSEANSPRIASSPLELSEEFTGPMDDEGDPQVHGWDDEDTRMGPG